MNKYVIKPLEWIEETNERGLITRTSNKDRQHRIYKGLFGSYYTLIIPVGYIGQLEKRCDSIEEAKTFAEIHHNDYILSFLSEVISK